VDRFLTARPWWRLEALDDAPSPGLSPDELASYNQGRYRDKFAVDAFLEMSVGDIKPRTVHGSDPAGPEHFDAYGAPLSEAAGEGPSWALFLNACLAKARVSAGPFRTWFTSIAIPEFLDLVQADEALVNAMPPPLLGEPQPGSVLGVRSRGLTSFYEGACNLIDRSVTVVHEVWAGGAGMLVYDSELFWLPDPVGAECVTSEVPDTELVSRIRLPFASILVGLARPVPASALRESDRDAWRLAMAPDGRRAALGEEPHLSAVWLAAGDDGFGVAPVVIWFVETGGGVSAVPGVWQRSAYSGAIANLGAVLTWENWVEPRQSDEALGDPGTKERRKALKRSAVRKALARGALHRIRVLTVPGPNVRPGGNVSDEVPAARRSPIRHWRRGHWTKVRVAVRSASGRVVGSTSGEKDVEWHYEGRWIRPVFVNPKGESDPGVKVYKQVSAQT
jgi:hypothetical protein